MTEASTLRASAADALHDAKKAAAKAVDDGIAAVAPSDAGDLVMRVAQGLHETVDRVADKAAPAAQKLEATVQDQVHRARELGDEWTDSLRSTVRERPISSVLVALAAGILISRITR